MLGEFQRPCLWLISLLRGINVGGHKKIKMAELRQLYVSLALDDVQSVLQSGNVVFRAGERRLYQS